MNFFENVQGAESLLWAAMDGRWDDAVVVAESLGPSAWGRRLIMGASPEEAGFKRCMEECNAPEGLWIEAQGGDAQRIERLLHIAKAHQSDSAKQAAGEWLGWMSAQKTAQALDVLALAAKEGSWPMAGWAKAMASKARRSKIGRDWTAMPAFWTLAARSGDSEDELFAALASSGLMAPMMAANAGAHGIAKKWVESLAPGEALAVLVAASCSNMEDWEMFEELCPKGLGGKSWREMALAGAGMAGANFEDLSLGGRHGPLSSPQWQDDSRVGREIFLGECAARSAPLLDSPMLAGAVSWIARRVPVRAAAKAMPGMAESFNIESGSAEEMIEGLECLAEINSGRLAELAVEAARRLWRSLPSDGAQAVKISQDRNISSAACALWSASSPAAFEAFIAEIGRLDSRPAAASSLSGFPAALLGGADLPASSGHVIALLRSIPPNLKTASGRGAWDDSDFSNLKICVSSAAAIALSGHRGERPPAPPMLPEPAHWGSLNLSEAKWRADASFAQAWDGWEGAFEAATASILAASTDSNLRMPKKPWPDGIPLEASSSRNAWSLYCLANPPAAAQMFCSMWMANGSTRAIATQHARSLSAQAISALAKAAPAAFEKTIANLNDFTAAARIDEACQAAASALAIESREAYSTRNVLCAAITCAASHGLARNSLSVSRSQDRGAMSQSARELSALLPSAAHFVLAAGFDGGEGYQADDLAGRAVVADLMFKSIGWGELGRELSMDAWRGISLNPDNDWTKSFMRGLFLSPPFTGLNSSEWGALFGQAMQWAKDGGMGGLERPAPSLMARSKNSVLEMAVNAVVSDAEGTFGEAAIRMLLAAGADPSDPRAPYGYDALALCAKLERRCSPSSLMKLLLDSPKARPGNGAVWSVLVSGKASLSDKMQESMHQAALKAPTSESLARMAIAATAASRPNPWFRQALDAPAAAPLLEDLMGTMLGLGASVGAAAQTHENLLSRGVAPSEVSLEKAFKAMLAHIAKAPCCEVPSVLAKWARIAPPLAKFDPSLLNGASCSDVSEAWKSRGGVGDVTICEALCSMALKAISSADRSKIALSQMAIESATLLSSGAMLDASAKSELSLLLSTIQGADLMQQVVAAVGPKAFAAMEADWLAQESAGPVAKGAGRRL